MKIYDLRNETIVLDYPTISDMGPLLALVLIISTFSSLALGLGGPVKVSIISCYFLLDVRIKALRWMLRICPRNN